MRKPKSRSSATPPESTEEKLDDVTAYVARAVEESGVPATARRLEVTPETLVRVLARQSVRRGTIALIREQMRHG